jgi:hypothetical protein
VSLSVRNVGASRLFGCLPLVDFETLEDGTFLVQLNQDNNPRAQQHVETTNNSWLVS